MKEKQTTDGAELATNQPITLDVPIVRGTTQITEVTVNKPNSSALRGTRLQALIETDVDSLIKVLPRITTPSLTAAEVANLDPADLYQLSQAVAIFFLPSSVRSDFLNI
ncbi:phage tail assembly protein [Serratia marcescens]|uniref:phage tail assembly protein n=1 Tax=Serratia marcescens TaxID=615 RepID=UPI0007454B79|nr:phage tail assembly protein [Serratia marcescens]CUY31940.1 Phage tail protein E [Serratia marcescens]CUZ09485.1 Phage tail protein E [Serratia marcescens]CUZ11639.1 Phage tail protein E [Serratia marcescens]CVA52498.1 Phage tail protein E [Serratia marcescens]CVA56206.1 Phage tail protein E [Serratia marcescens]